MITPHLLVSEGDVTRYALLPGDPGRVRVITEFLESPVKLSENREFLVYKGVYKGVGVTVCSTGIGGPSAAIAVEELARCGSRILLRVGTCGALVRGVKPGEIVLPYAAVRLDGASARYVDPRYPAVAHPRVLAALEESLKRAGLGYRLGLVLSDDRFYSGRDELLEWGARNVVAVEMECSTIFSVASLKGLAGGAVLVVDGNIAEGTGKASVGGASRSSEHDERVRRAIREEVRAALEALVLLEERGL